MRAGNSSDGVDTGLVIVLAAISTLQYEKTDKICKYCSASQFVFLLILELESSNWITYCCYCYTLIWLQAAWLLPGWRGLLLDFPVFCECGVVTIHGTDWSVSLQDGVS